MAGMMAWAACGQEFSSGYVADMSGIGVKFQAGQECGFDGVENYEICEL